MAPEGKTFKHTANLADLKPEEDGEEDTFVYVMAVAKVDQSWADRSNWDTSPNLAPQVFMGTEGTTILLY